jgi:hypothetical protein
MDNTFLYRMPAGIAGAISRPQDLTVEPQTLDSTNHSPRTALAGSSLRVSLCRLRRLIRLLLWWVSMFVRTRPPPAGQSAPDWQRL